MRSHGIPAATPIAAVLLGPSLEDEARAEDPEAPRVSSLLSHPDAYVRLGATYALTCMKRPPRWRCKRLHVR